jgi:uncharacterized protein YdaU (DUF1376 family)
MEAALHYYQFNIGDYASHTRHLSLIEDLAYRRLLDVYYLRERPLSDCLTTVARLIGLSDYEQEVEAVLVEFFEHNDGGYVNPRADKEIAHYRAKSQQAVKAGKASAERRFNIRSTDVQPNNNQEPITSNHKPIKKSIAARGTRLPQDFQLPMDWIVFCNQQRPELDARDVFEGFCDYWIAQPGQKGVKTDWTATWRNWVRRQQVAKKTESERAREHMAELTRGMATPKPKNFWEKTIDETNEVIHVETKRLL